MRTRRLLATIMIALTASSASAVTLVPGAYKMSWDVRREFADPLWRAFASDYCSPLSCSDPTPAIAGAVSSHAVTSGSFGSESYSFVIDESRGTGKGYDVLYLGHIESFSAEEMEFIKAATVRLRQRAGGIGANGYPVRIAGRKRLVDVGVTFNRVEEPKLPGTIRLYVRGAWYGSIKSDKGPIQVRLSDSYRPGRWETVMLGRGDDYGAHWLHKPLTVLHASDKVTFDNKLYSLKVSASGDILTVRRYSGPTGRIAVRAVDGFGKPAGRCDLVLMMDSGALRYSVSDGQSIAAPVGRYGFVSVCLAQGRPNDVSVDAELAPLNVRSGRATTLKLGGPLTFKLTAERMDDGHWTVNCRPRMPGRQKMNSLPCNIKMALTLKGDGGRVVYSERQSGFDSRGVFRLPRGLKPGNYVALVKADLRPYDRIKTFGAQLRIR